MKLGIDFGTTHIVVAAADRGNYPVVEFEAPDGSTHDWFPPVFALREAQPEFGWDAWLAQSAESSTVIRSTKRLLESAGINTRLDIAGCSVDLGDALDGIARSLEQAIRASSNVNPGSEEPLEVLLGVPAHANSNQRFLTAEAFRRAGFQVLGLLNEPSAASIEFAHSHRLRTGAEENGCVLIYDLGGGTFDASLVELDSRTHTVLAAEGIETLGGDDFDEVLAQLALEAAGLAQDRENLTQAEWFLLHEECRRKKEALNPNTRKITIDLDTVRPHWSPIAVSAADFHQQAEPLVEETLHTLLDLLAAQDMDLETWAASDGKKLDAVYLIGGASELPLIPRLLRERFGRRLRRSAHPRSASAIGLAIQADRRAGYLLRDRFTRYFGVWRETDAGVNAAFDPLFVKGAQLPGPGEPPLTASRNYHPAHNIGHFRYQECSRLSPAGQPDGEITVWDEILYPFEDRLESLTDLKPVPVERSTAPENIHIEERYYCEAGGTLRVEIENRETGHIRRYRLARWSPEAETLQPGRSARPRAKSARP